VNKGETTRIQGWLERLRSGDESAMDELLVHFDRRLFRLTRMMLKSYPGVHRWEQTDDVFQQASLRLRRALLAVAPGNTREFLGLAALQVRRELLNMAEAYRGWESPSRGHRGRTAGANGQQYEPVDHAERPGELAEWTEFHDVVARLPEPILQVFELMWYGGLETHEVADALNIALRTVQLRWQKARMEIREALGNRLPGS
jgi:RNA polymerase sigma-70 factor (ECF subfamily)